MTLERFQRLVLKIGNQMMTRHYLWLNYPSTPQLMGIGMECPPTEGGIFWREMKELGFRQYRDNIWVIERIF